MPLRSVAVTVVDQPTAVTGRSPVPAYDAAFFLIGMAMVMSGPALPHLRERAGVSIGVSGLFFGAQALGYVIASLAVGRWYDRGHGTRLLTIACLVVATMVVGLAAIGEVVLMMVMFVVLGGAAAVADVGGNTMTVWATPPARVTAGLNTLHLCFGFGALLTPILVSRSLEWSGDLRWHAVVVVVLTAAICWRLATSDAPSPRAAVERSAAEHSARRLGLMLLCAFFFLNVGVEASFAGWTSTYAEEVDLGAGTPGLLTAVFWVGFTAGRIVVIGLASRMRAATILGVTVTGAAAAALALAIGDGVSAVIWAATAMFGFLVGPQFPTMLAYGDERLRLSGSSTSFIVASSGVGGLVLPVMVGVVLDRHGVTLMPWLVAGGAIALALVTAVTIHTGSAD